MAMAAWSVVTRLYGHVGRALQTTSTTTVAAAVQTTADGNASGGLRDCYEKIAGKSADQSNHLNVLTGSFTPEQCAAKCNVSLAALLHAAKACHAGVARGRIHIGVE